MTRILVVAHQTAAGDELAAAVRARLEAGPCEFTLLVPTTPARDLADKVSAMGLMAAGAEAGVSLRAAPVADPYTLARGQLERGLAKLRAVGATVTGEVGSDDPVAGILEILGRHQFDEIIVSTLPKRVSRWLHQDLPRRIERKFKLPVTVVTQR